MNAEQQGLANLLALLAAALMFGLWQHSVHAGGFAFAALYVLMPFYPSKH